MWIKVDDGFAGHPKVFTAGKKVGRRGTGRVLAVWLEALCWTNKYETDGFLPAEVVQAFRHDPNPLQVAAALVHAALWEVREGGWQIHDYAEYQQDAAARATLAKERADAGRRGAQARWQTHGKWHGKGHGKRNGKTMAKNAPDPDPDPVPGTGERTAVSKTDTAPPSAVADGPRVLTPKGLQAAWNRHAPPLPKCEDLNASRTTHAKARLREHPAADYWHAVIARLSTTPFALGQGVRGWRANFDWLLRPSSAARVLEGQYDSSGTNGSKSAGNFGNLRRWLDPERES